jgi:hypothetical protein
MPGIALDTVGHLVLAVVLIVGLLVVLFFVIPEISAYLFSKSELVEAIKCSYYRCTKGCSYAENRVNDELFDCSEFCSAVPANFRPDNKICGANAKKYPVIIDVGEDNTIKKDMPLRPECIVETDSHEDEQYIRSADKNWIVVDEDIILSAYGDEECRTYLVGGASYDGHGSVSLTGQVSIFSDVGGTITMTDDLCDVILKEGEYETINLVYSNTISGILVCIEGSEYRAALNYESTTDAIFIEIDNSGLEILGDPYQEKRIFHSGDHRFEVTYIGDEMVPEFPTMTTKIGIVYGQWEEPPPPTDVLPDDYPESDSWTESTDNWNRYMSVELRTDDDEEDVKYGDYSIAFRGEGVIFDVSDAIGSNLNLNEWDNVHFWLKREAHYTPNYPTVMQIIFADTSMHWFVCDFDDTIEWIEYNVDLNANKINWWVDSSADCRETSGFDPTKVNEIIFRAWSENPYFWTYVDELYLSKD